LNFAGKSGLLGGFGSGTHGHSDLLSKGADTITVPDAHLLFSGDYERSGADLIISDQLHRVVVPNYFNGDKRPTLVSPQGAPLDPKFIEALTGHVQYAQAAGSAAAPKVVGHVVKMTGSASIVRNGVTIDVNNGDIVYQNDVVQTGSGSTLGLVMIDGTTFNLSANARLMMNDLTYDATSTSNTSLFTLVQGAANFVAGQVAKTGDMKVSTPLATMGIRGTAAILDFSAIDGAVTVSVVDQRDGQIHALQVYNPRGDLIATVVSNGSVLTLRPTVTFEVIAQESNKTVAQVLTEFNAFQQLLSTYEIGKQLFPNTPFPTDGRRGDNTQQPLTKFAGSTISPIDSSSTKFNAEIAGTKDINGDAGADDASGPTGEITEITTRIAFNSGDAPIQFVDVPATSIPFVVTPSPVSRISSGPGDHFGPVMSADGQFVTYDPDGAIYLFDRQTGATSTIAAPGEGFSYGSPTISSDGHFVVYQGSDGTQSWIFIYNNDASDPAHYGQTTRLMSGGQPAISGDGSKLVIERGGSIGLYDQQGHELANITGAAVGITGTLWKPAISADGHVIAFWSSNSSSPGGAGQLFTYDLSTATVRPIGSTATGAGDSAASFSADGHYLVYQSDAPGGHSEIYLYDLRAGQVVFHTANPDPSYNPVLSPDGHFIILASDARLTADDRNAVTDIYVIDVTDLSRPAYKLVSVLDDGTQGDDTSNLGAAISAGGQFIAFGSRASNFSSGDRLGTGDIFVVDPTSGHSAIILESRNSPAVLGTSGVIKLTGERSGVTLGVSDSRLSVSFDSHGDIQWSFSEPRSDFASLQPGQLSVLNFVITLRTDRSTTEIPVKVSIYDVDQPGVSVADAAPVASPVTLAAGTEDTGYTITSAALLAGVVDIDGPSLSITAVGVISGGGTIVDNHNGSFSYTPAPNYNGPVVFNYTASDGTLSASSTASLNVGGVNDAPVVTKAAFAVPEGGTVVLGAANIGATDPDSTSFTFAVSNVTHGTFQTTADGIHWTNATAFTTADLSAGHVRFVHDGGELAPTFSIRASDGAASNNQSNVLAGSVTFANVNDAPVITTAALTIPEGATVVLGASNIGVSDPDNNSFVFTTSNVSRGAFEITADGSTWVPVTTFNSSNLNAGHVRFVHDGSEDAPTFSIQADDGTGSDSLSNAVTGSVNFSRINDAPVFMGRAAGVASVGTGNPVPVATNVSASDVDSDNYNGASLAANVTFGNREGDTLSLAQQTQFIFLNGSTVMFDPDGTGFGQGAIAIGTLRLGPALSALSVALNENAGDAAVAALTQAVQFSTVPGHGNAVSGTRTVTFTLVDGGGAFSQFDAMVDIAANHAPGAVDDSDSITAGTTAVRGNLLANDTDAEHETLSVSNVMHGASTPQIITVEGTYGELVVDRRNGDYSYTLATTRAQADAVRALGDHASATDSFTYTAFDGVLGDDAELKVTVTGINDAPTVTALSAVRTEDDGIQAFDLLSGAHDVDSDALTVAHFVAAAQDQNNLPVDLSRAFGAGAIVIGPNTITVDPHYFNHLNVGQSVTLVGEYDVFDGRVFTHNTSSLTINGANDAPVVTSVTLTIGEGGTVVLRASDIGVTDPDNDSFTFTASNVTHGAFQTTANGTTWVAATTFTTADLNAGHVRFVHDGSEDAPTFSIQANDGAGSNNLSNVVAGSVSFTHVNDAPVITHASLTIAQGHTVTLTTADIDFVDPDNSVVTYTVSNPGHGHFEIGLGNAADVTTTFTSADVAAGLVSFVDDGSSGIPTFSLTPNDGSIDGVKVAGVVTFSAANYTLTSTEGVVINVTPEGATSGFVFPGAGNVTTPGTPEDRIAIGYDVGASHVVRDNAPLLRVHEMAPLSSETHSSGGTSFVSTTLDASHGVTLKQTIALGSDANFFTTTIEIDNTGAADISNLRFLRNFDPDQDVQVSGPYETFNDVVQKPDGAESFAIVSAKGVVSHTTVAMVGFGAEWQGSVFGFTNTDPYAAGAFDFPVDPGGARADKSLSLTSSLGTLTANGGHVEVTYITTNNVATSGSNALYGTVGDDTIDGLGGDDLLIGLKGTDTFVFNAASAGSGHDTIADFMPGQDKISLDYHAFDANYPNDFSNWLTTHATVSGSDVLIDLNVNGNSAGVDTILLKSVALANLHAGDFHTL
jgi:VCBS repeat-containing protein